MDHGVSRHRTVSALLVDVDAGHAAQIARALDASGWTVRSVPVNGPEALSAALQHRGWDVVLYAGDGLEAVPSRKALALVRLADPHLPFIAVSPNIRPGELSAVLRGLPSGVPSVPVLGQLSGVLTRELERTFAAGQGLPGRVWAFRRAVWLNELPGEAVRAGLVTAAAFPIAHGDECVGVIELYASDARESNAEVSALFSTVGGQLAAYLARRRVRARRSFDAAGARVVALDAVGRVDIASGTACSAFGYAQDELLGRDWFATAVAEHEREAAREAFSRLLAGDGTVGLPHTPGVSWRWSPSRDADGRPIGVLGWGEPRPKRLVAASALP